MAPQKRVILLQPVNVPAPASRMIAHKNVQELQPFRSRLADIVSKLPLNDKKKQITASTYAGRLCDPVDSIHDLGNINEVSSIAESASMPEFSWRMHDASKPGDAQSSTIPSDDSDLSTSTTPQRSNSRLEHKWKPSAEIPRLYVHAQSHVDEKMTQRRVRRDSIATQLSTASKGKLAKRKMNVTFPRAKYTSRRPPKPLGKTEDAFMRRLGVSVTEVTQTLVTDEVLHDIDARHIHRLLLDDNSSAREAVMRLEQAGGSTSRLAVQDFRRTVMRLLREEFPQKLQPQLRPSPHGSSSAGQLSILRQPRALQKGNCMPADRSSDDPPSGCLNSVCNAEITQESNDHALNQTGTHSRQSSGQVASHVDTTHPWEGDAEVRALPMILTAAPRPSIDDEGVEEQKNSKLLQNTQSGENAASQNRNTTRLIVEAALDNVPKDVRVPVIESVRTTLAQRVAERQAAKKNRPNVLLVGRGKYNPIHKMHVRHFVIARQYLEGRTHLSVLGGLLIPKHATEVRQRCRQRPREIIPPRHRLAMVRAAVGASPWLTVDPWEITRRRVSDYPSTLDHIRQLFVERFPTVSKPVRLVFLVAPDELLRLNLDELRTAGYECITICRPQEYERLLAQLGSRWTSVAYVVEDSALLSAELEATSTAKLRRDLVKNQTVTCTMSTILPCAVKDYILRHRIPEKVSASLLFVAKHLSQMSGTQEWTRWDKEFADGEVSRF